MALTFHPHAGLILLCDFSQGFKEPEMVKNRPVIVLSQRSQLVTIVPLSTKIPKLVKDFHYCLPKEHLPQLGRFQKDETWVKGDMLYTVGFHRLNLIRLGKRKTDGKRIYFTRSLPLDVLKTVRGCVLHGLNIGGLTKHL